MGVLNIPGRIKGRVSSDYNFDVIGWDDFVEDSEFDVDTGRNDGAENIILTADEVHQCHQRRSHERRSKPKNHDHFGRRKKGVRGKRRYDNMCQLLSLVETLEIGELDEGDDCKTPFSDLFVDQEKMKMWNDFVNLSEEKQEIYLDRCCGKSKLEKQCTKIEDTDSLPKLAFGRIDQKIKDYLRSKALSKDSLKAFEEDILSTMLDFPTAVLVMNIPSSYSRILVHGICQYSGLHALTHKYGPECLMEIESGGDSWCCPPQTLHSYLDR